MYSSVARGAGGGLEPPIVLWSMQNCTFLVLLRPIFCEKLKIAPPYENSPPSNVWISEFGRKISLNFGEDLFFFGDHLNLGGKNLWISELSEKFRLDFRTNRVKLIQEQWKFGSRSFALFSLFQKSHSKSWLRAWWCSGYRAQLPTIAPGFDLHCECKSVEWKSMEYRCST